jgi:Ca-activated chloride channel family protein
MFPISNILKKGLISVCLSICFLGFYYTIASADGIVIPDPPPLPEPIPFEETLLTIRYHRVSVSIENQVAVTRVAQEFVNECDWEVEGTYIFPIPEGASISKFVMWVDGEPIEGKILPADEARQIYEDIVRKRRDPALLEYIGRDAVQARIYPIPPGGSRKIELEYTQVLSVDNGMVRYSYPLNTEKFSARPLEECSVRIDLYSKEPLHSIYSPTHQDRVYIQRDGDHQVIIGYEEEDILPDQDFDLIYTFSNKDIGLHLLTYPNFDYDSYQREGYFLLMAAPAVEVDHVIPRDIILLLDTSGSMDGEKLIQAKAAAKYVLGHLNEEDRFNIIAFSTGINHFAMSLQPASEAEDAAAWINRMDALGGTNINLALLEALSLGDDSAFDSGGRPLVILFLTDGLPTEGVTEIDQIIANINASATSNLRLFSFGVGDDVNTVLLDTLAGDNRGVSSYVRPEERIDEEVSALFAKIKTPVLTDLELDFGGIHVEEIYPPELPDLFSGTQLLLVGRYRLPGIGSGKTSIELTGYVNNKQKSYKYDVDFSSADEIETANSYIPRLWATRKIGYLLSQIRIQGENQEWVDAIVKLSVKYGIITPYTSFLIQEQNFLTGEGSDEIAEEWITDYAGPAVGAQAVEKADAESELRSAESIYQPVMPSDDMMPDVHYPLVKYVEDKTFLYQDGIWIDSAYDPKAGDTIKIGFGSSVYFDMLSARPSVGRYLALGDRVIVLLDGDAYEIVEGEGEIDSLPPALSQSTDERLSNNREPRRAGDDNHQPGIRSICNLPLLLGLVGFALVYKKLSY